MIGIITALGLVLLANFVIAQYLKLRASDARRAIDSAEQIHAYSKQVAADLTIPDIVADTVLDMARASGDGSITKMLFRFALGVAGIKADSTSPLDSGFAMMTGRQKKMVGHLIVQSVIFDTLKSPLLGRIVRRRYYWMIAVETSAESEVVPNQVTPIMAQYRDDPAHMDMCPA